MIRRHEEWMPEGLFGRGFGSVLTVADFPPLVDRIGSIEKSGWLSRLYTPFERSYDGIPVLLWSRQHYYLAPLACCLYIPLVTYGPRLMANRKAYDLRTALKYWNLFLAVFSLIGATRVLPYLFYLLYSKGVSSTLCAPPVFTYGRGAAGLWTALFIYSKYVELIDTVFIVLRKRELHFLHWYHHFTVLLYTWDAFVTEQPPGLYYCAMNYTVHAIMYFYYYLAAARTRPPRWGKIVTVLQISQMIAGVLITAFSILNSFRFDFMYASTHQIAANPKLHNACFVSRSNMLLAAVMYSTYFYLFAAFFVKRYVKPRPNSATASRPTLHQNAQNPQNPQNPQNLQEESIQNSQKESLHSRKEPLDKSPQDSLQRKMAAKISSPSSAPGSGPSTAPGTAGVQEEEAENRLAESRLAEMQLRLGANEGDLSRRNRHAA